MSRVTDESKVFTDTKLKLKYDIMNKLGEGCFGTIFKAINRISKKQVALKLEHLVPHGNLSTTRSNLSN